jgi:RNA polymerase sigma-70 factor (ECF subfamily)
MNRKAAWSPRPDQLDPPELDAASDFEAIVEAYEGPLLRYVGNLLGHLSEATQDVVQDTFLRLHRQIRKQGSVSIGSLKPWLFRVAHNLATDHARLQTRQRKLRQAVQEQARADAGQRPASPAQPGSDQGVVGQLMHEEALRHARRRLEELPEHLRIVVHLKLIEGMTLRQICDITGLTVGNAGYRLNQGLKTLAEELKQLGAI